MFYLILISAYERMLMCVNVFAIVSGLARFCMFALCESVCVSACVLCEFIAYFHRRMFVVLRCSHQISMRSVKRTNVYEILVRNYIRI